MEEVYEQSLKNLESLKKYYEANESNRNEATTRFQLIDQLLLDCLGWSRNDITTEQNYAGTYTDYNLSAPRNVLIIEAKKEGSYFEIPIGSNNIIRSISNLCRDNPKLKAAVEQVASYCQTRGVPYGAVCNGHQVVVFIATRSDGIAPLDGRAYVFASLDQMLDNFLVFWNTLSKSGVEQQLLRNELTGSALPELPPKLSESIPGYPGVKNRNSFQADLQILSDLVIEDVVNSEELRSEFLLDCYVQSGALSQYALLSKNILQARYAAIFGSELEGPATLPVFEKKGKITPELIAKSFSRRPILLLGDVGAGKSTFIQYLINIEAAPLLSESITIVLNLGTAATLTTDIKDFVLGEINNQLLTKHGIDTSENGFVRDVYKEGLKSFNKGIFGPLRELNPSEYQNKEIDFLSSLLQKREDHLKHALKRIAATRQKQIVIFFDNVDQRDEQTQQELFLISQEIAENWFPVTVFVTLRAETFYRSQRLGAISGYHPKAFTISPPRTDTVITKRLAFAKKITEGKLSLSSLQDIELNLKALGDLISVFQFSLKNNESLPELIENVAGGNIRLALDLIRGFFGSGHIDSHKIVDIYREKGSYIIPLHEFLRALIYGNSKYYSPNHSPVVNLFDLSSLDKKEHFLLPILLSSLVQLADTGEDSGFVEIAVIYDKLQALGFTPEQIDLAVTRGHRGKLLQSSAGRIPRSGEMPQTLRITSVGAYHVSRLCEQFPYLDAVVVDTPILDRTYRDDIRHESSTTDRVTRAEIFRSYLDSIWSPLATAGADSYFDWLTTSKALEKNLQTVKQKLTNLAMND